MRERAFSLGEALFCQNRENSQMAPRQVIDFLHWAENYHKTLGDFYRHREEDAIWPEVKVLLAYMARHQDALCRIIEEYERGASKTVLDTWYKVSPDPKGFKDPETAGFYPGITMGQVINLALDLDKSLISMYELLVRNALSPDLHEMLASLLQAERSDEIRLMRAEPNT